MRNAINFLVDLRRQSKAFTIQKVVGDTGLCEQAVRNFESGKSTNGVLFHYYLVRLMRVSDEMADSIIDMLKKGDIDGKNN
ncbi:MAG: hypothetical protein IIY21_10925 [Clostridiales bacterium]|nr:hypothetical protein [Clostridiales bacterium]MBQ1571179.1 hypothetical protein [Clostridiales bacterium]